jgi:hypothetical protein
VVRILDLDLDFFIDGVTYWKPSDSERLSAEDFPPWPLEQALGFLEGACKLNGKLPGLVVEHHGELFAHWRKAIEAGKLAPPFAVTHVDGHADLGLGDIGYDYLITELLFAPPKDRQFPKTGIVTDGNWLAFAIACQWVSDFVYVLNSGGPPGDLMPYFMEGWFTNNDRKAGFASTAKNIELPAMDKAEFDKRDAVGGGPLNIRYEPKVPFSWVSWKSFATSEPYDVVCLARSPGFTPAESDELFDEIRERFIDESAFR